MSSQNAASSEFEAFASELETEDHDPFEVHDFQRTILEPFFDGVPNTVIIMPKKNGKTTLIAALALYHLLVTPNADCIIVAASREQAGVCLKSARIFVRNSAELSQVTTINQRTIHLKGEEGRIRILASDEDTLDGENPTLAIVDELHRHKNLEVYGVLRDGMVRPGARMVTISTAGANLDSPLGQIRANAHEMAGFTRQGTLNRVRTDTFAFFEWCLDADADVDDLGVVKTANPAPWQTIAKLEERRNEPGMTLYRWLRFACGIWTEGEEPWMDPTRWDGLARPGLELGTDVWLAVCVGNIGEESAIVAASWDGETLLEQAHILRPDTPRAKIEDTIRSLADTYHVLQVAYVPRQFDRSADLLADEGFEMIEFPLTAERLGRASSHMYELIEAGNFAHPGDREFRAHVMAGVVREDRQGWSLVKNPATNRPVTALLAAAMASQTALDYIGGELLVGWA